MSANEKLLKLCTDHTVADREFHRLVRRLEKQEDALRGKALIPRPPMSPGRHADKDARRLHAAAVKAYKQQRRELGLEPTDQAIADCTRRWHAARQGMVKTPAESMLGVAIKLQAIKSDLSLDTLLHHGGDILRSAAADAERLARKEMRWRHKLWP
jgi:hypothetical protein